MINKRVLGRTAFEVSEVSLGAWQLGGRGYGPVSRNDAFEVIESFLELGGNFIDTATRYGDSERILGEYFSKYVDREDLFIASKTPFLEEDAIRADVEESLRLLNTDYIDLYYLHAPPGDQDDMHRALDAFEILVEEGKINAIGASIKGPDVTQQTVDLCRQYIRSGRVDVLMVIYSIFRQLNAKILPEAVRNQVGIVARTVLESGFLTGKYLPGDQFLQQDHRHRWQGEHLKRILEEVQALQAQVVQPPYENLAQIAVRFALDKDGISNVVLGARTPAQSKSNIECSSLPPLPERLTLHLMTRFEGRTEEFNTGGRS